MKNYTISNVDAKTFILNYEIKDGQIIINLASKEKYVIPYTEENEKKIIERMEYQVEYAPGIKNDCETAIHKTKNYSIRWFMGFMISIIFAIISIIFKNPLNPFVNIVPSISCLTGAIINLSIMLNNKSKLEDIKKNELFLTVKDKINDNIKGNNPNILANVSQKTKAIVESAEGNEPAITINDIDSMSLKELKQILENISIAKRFDFEYPNQEELNQSQEETSHEVKKPKVNIKK